MNNSNNYIFNRCLKLIALIGILWLPSYTYGIEPIGTIGKPLPEKHAFYSNNSMIRVVRTEIQIVDTITGDVIDKIGNFKPFDETVLSPINSLIAIQKRIDESDGSSIGIWDYKTRELISEFKIDKYGVIKALSPTEPIIVTYDDKEIDLWNWQTGKHLGSMRPAYDKNFEFTPDGKNIIIAARIYKIRTYNVATGKLEGYFDGNIEKRIEGIAISPNGKYLATFEDSNTFSVWNIPSRKLHWKTDSGTGPITDIEFSPDSQKLYVSNRANRLSKRGDQPFEGWDDNIRAWDVNPKNLSDTISTEFRNIKSFTISPDGKTVLIHYADGEVLWDNEAKRIRSISADYISFGHGFSERGLSPDGRTFILVTPYFIKTWDVPTQRMRLLISSDGYRFRGFAVSPNSKKLIAGLEGDRRVQVHNLQTGNIENVIPHSLSYVEDIVFGDTGRWLAVSDDWDELAILDLDNPNNPQKLNPKIEGLPFPLFTTFGFSDNDEYFISAAINNRHKDGMNQSDELQFWILLWKRQEDQFAFQYAWKGYALGSRIIVTTGPKGDTVLATVKDGEYSLWNLLPDAPKLITSIYGEEFINFSSEGRFLYDARENFIQIWDWQESKLTGQLPIPYVIDLSRNESTILSIKPDYSGQYLVWDGHELSSTLTNTGVEPQSKKLVILGQIKKNQLLQNYPNPFNPETWIPFRLAKESNVTINIFTPTGTLIRTLSLGKRPAGDYLSHPKAVHWDGRNNTGEHVSSGIYFYTINADEFSATRKMLIRK